MIRLTPATGAIAGAVVTAGSVAVLAWRERPEPGAGTLAVLMLAAAWWSGTHLGMLLAETMSGALLWARLQWFGSVGIPVAWVLFAFEYTGNDRYVRPSVVAGLLVLPALTIVLLWTNDVHNLVRVNAQLVEDGGYLVLESVWGPWFYISVAYAYLLAAAGTVLFAQLAVTSSFLYRSQAVALLVGAALPWLSHLVYLLDVGEDVGLGLMATSFSGTGLVLLFALTRGKLLEASPVASRLASDFVIEGLDDGVVVIDSRDRVVDLNPAAASILGTGSRNAVGRPASAVLAGYEEDSETESDVAIETADGTRYFDVQLSALRDYHDRLVGRAAVLRDVTDRRRRNQRLAVLHRILRHNLRNEMTVIRGHAEGLDDEHGETIEESASRVIGLSEKAAKVERMATDDEEAEPIDLADAVGDALQSLEEEHPETAFTVGDLPGVGCRSTVGTAVLNLIENAAEHNTNPDPKVRIEATREGSEVRITVADNGPGIPPIERNVLENDSETPLRHGSGIGLWLVSWAVDTVGGSVEFADNEPTGSVVTLRVPLIEPGE
ncbi:histidine kinase N-terminal 7TM domain-containing protein [Halalkalicoccus subterraneus]|uniref:histidine kinase N-terminal 7TM domain-containing protein n=1 Tax=Halalkalicoccus subterraneus TaxID=2675002 RepID=UPI000EFC2FDA|nr:histidine kinase N-terminal 7TM domain-containing protein [Halalkalicoccus subterraneus]